MAYIGVPSGIRGGVGVKPGPRLNPGSRKPGIKSGGKLRSIAATSKIARR